MAVWIWCAFLFLFAGSQLFFEVLIEWVVIMWILSDPYFSMHSDRAGSPFTSSALMKLFARLSSGKIEKLREVLHGSKPGLTVLILVLSAIAMGIAMMFPQIVWRDWATLLARELVEISLDFLIFVPAYFVIRAFYRKQRGLIQARQAALRKIESEAHDKEDEILNAEPSGYEDTATWSSFGGFTWPSEKERIEKSYFLSSLSTGYPFGPAPIEFVREEQIGEREAAFAEELQTARIFRGITFLIGLLPFAAGLIEAVFIDWRIVDIIAPHAERVIGPIIERAQLALF